MKEKISAVEWLVDMLDIDKNDSSTKDVIDQANQMEKERMIDFAKYCLNNAKYLNFEKALFNIEEYYEIFKSK